MKFAKEDYKYLEGKDFSSGYRMNLANNPLYTREDFLVKILKGKNVIHVGCCDHIPLIKEKIERKKWLHGLLEDVCPYVLGLDINQEAIDYVNKSHFAKSMVHCADITSNDLSKYIGDREIHFVLMGEILEHTDNPVAFLTGVKDNMHSIGFSGQYIITVPNVLGLSCTKTDGDGYEFINTDHKYWFTPYTISKVMIRAGITPEELLFCGEINNQNRIVRKFVHTMNTLRKVPLSYNSFCANTIIAIGH